MAGIYIHIPFCSSRCIYCDFYSTTFGLEQRKAYVTALCDELRCRKDELNNQKIRTVYFGGGTPSLLLPGQVERIISTLYSNFDMSSVEEITLESNPDDVTLDLAKDWKSLGINRISLGLQTFNDTILKKLRRRHTSATACKAVDFLRQAGFDNLTLDLIYGLPAQTFDGWKEDVQRLLDLQVQHLSAYALSYEPGTVLTRMLECGDIQEAGEEMIRKMYKYLLEQTALAGFEHYEISNFALPGFISRHNSSYWSGVPYLGVGPGAHSYDGHACRRANLPSLQAYLESEGDVPHQKEFLSDVQLYEEYLLTGLRTSKGISVDYVRDHFGESIFKKMKVMAAPHLLQGNLQRTDDGYCLTKEGILISDYIISDLMLADDDE